MKPILSPVPRLSGSPARNPRAWGSRLALAAITSAVLLATACGYRLLGAGGSFPPAVKTIAVTPFQRQVPVLQLEQRITEAVTRELVQRAHVRVQSQREGADAVLTGAVTGYGVAPVSYDSAGRANRYQVNVSARVKLEDAGGKVLFESQGYRFSEIYERASSPQTYVNEEVVAYDEVARDFARALVASILEGSPGDR
jgi:outer membrane lipopolysaccharide assembly protein LptE/RlpB